MLHIPRNSKGLTKTLGTGNKTLCSIYQGIARVLHTPDLRLCFLRMLTRGVPLCSEDIVAWVKRKTGPASHLVEAAADLEKFSEDEVVVLTYLSALEVPHQYPRLYALFPRAIGSDAGYMLSSLVRLVPTPGICSLSSYDWFRRRVYALFPCAIGSGAE
eukprot:1191351-Prorocentrum_minimum.AAC.8